MCILVYEPFVALINKTYFLLATFVKFPIISLFPNHLLSSFQVSTSSRAHGTSICIYAYLFMYVRLCLIMYVYVCAVHGRICLYVCVYMFVLCVCMYVYVCLYICVPLIKIQLPNASRDKNNNIFVLHACRKVAS